jgi:hypothetical protein
MELKLNSTIKKEIQWAFESMHGSKICPEAYNCVLNSWTLISPLVSEATVF